MRKRTKFWFENLKDRDNLGDLGADDNIKTELKETVFEVVDRIGLSGVIL
jgi:hypothetical protein